MCEILDGYAEAFPRVGKCIGDSAEGMNYRQYLVHSLMTPEAKALIGGPGSADSL